MPCRSGASKPSFSSTALECREIFELILQMIPVGVGVGPGTWLGLVAGCVVVVFQKNKT
jgi:hypothetical protein